MRKTSIIALALILTVSMLTGCRSRRNDMDTNPDASVLPTNEENATVTTTPATETTHATRPEPATTENIPDDTFDGTTDTTGDGMMDDMMDETIGENGTGNDIAGRIRRNFPRNG